MKAVIVSGLCVFVLSGCAVKKVDGKWRQMEVDEAERHFVNGQLASAKRNCDKVIDNTSHRDCTRSFVEPQELLRQRLNNNDQDNKVESGPSGPFSMPAGREF